MENDFFVNSGIDSIKLVPSPKESAQYVSVHEYNRVVKERDELLRYFRNKEAEEVIDEILAEERKA